MKKLPIGKQDFKSLINEDYIYVDKTEHIYNLIQGTTYFLSRPRRFGKSLLISTLKEIFLGNKEVFKGLWIYNKHEFSKHPVIHLSFSQLDYKNLGLEQALLVKMGMLASESNITLKYSTASLCFEQIIRELCKETKKTVILIDEYDKPIVDYIIDNAKCIENLSILKNFFSILKDADEYIKFLFITGVSKFSMVSIFSDLNHLKDISLDKKYATIVGLTEIEIEQNFDAYFKEVIEELNISKETLIVKMREMYNGYLFNSKGTSVYNPFSVLNFFADKEFNYYWFSTGTPTFLIEALKNRDIDIVNELPKEISKEFINKLDLKNIDKIDVWTLLYQTGYLTIKSYDDELNSFTLDFPNNEVKRAFLSNILEVYAFNTPSYISTSVIQINRGLLTNNWALIVEHINIIFAGIPYQIFTNKGEFFYHAIVHTIISLAGANTLSEVQTNKGRIDCLIKTPKQQYIVEFKIGTPESALQQIEQNQYFKQFLNNPLPCYLIGVGFSIEQKAIGGWIAKAIV